MTRFLLALAFVAFAFGTAQARTHHSHPHHTQHAAHHAHHAAHSRPA